jgi:hypothetical protein
MAKRKGLGWATAIAGVALGAGWFLWSRSDLVRIAQSLDSEVAAAQKDGMPMTIEEVRASIRERTPGANAAPLYLGAFSLAKGQQMPSELADRFLGGAATGPDGKELRSRLASLGPALTLFERGTAQASLNYDRRWELGLSLLLPDLADHKKLVTALTMRGLLEAQAGDLARAEKTMVTAARATAHLKADPLLISYLVCLADEAVVLRGARRIVSERPQDPAARRLARAVLTTLGPMPDLRQVCGVEATVARKAVNELGMDGVLASLSSSGIATAPPTARFAATALRVPPVRQANEAKVVRFWREMHERIPEDPNDVAGMAQAVDGMERQYGDMSGLSSAMLNLLAPSLQGVVQTAKIALARRKVLATALDLLDAKARTGVYPATVKVSDPWGGSLRYRRQPGGFVLYSVGADGKDDGGTERGRDDGEASGTDIVFSIPVRKP